MKKALVFVLTALLALTLAACGEDRSGTAVHTPSINGTTYTVDTKNCTISDGEYTYSYEYIDYSDGYSISVSYPDGSSWYMEERGGITQSGHSNGYGPGAYLPGERISALVRDALEDTAPVQRPSGARIFLAVVLLCSGALGLFSPKAAWLLEWGWRFKDAEPSGAVLFVNRVAGVVCIVAGFLVLF